MPGMDMGAPERTDTSSGSSASPIFLPMRASRSSRYSWMVPSAPSGHALPALAYSMQVWHVMVNPGGTGSPMLAISARFAPLPPRIAFMLVLPSVTLLPCASLPNAYTRLTSSVTLFSLTRRTDFTYLYIGNPSLRLTLSYQLMEDGLAHSSAKFPAPFPQRHDFRCG